jgi:hypothetical protein
VAADVLSFQKGMQRLRPAVVSRQTQVRLHNRPILDVMEASKVAKQAQNDDAV